jgi:multiple sugar transport system substrate-binding protein
MKNSNIFQISLMVACIFFAVGGLIVFGVFSRQRGEEGISGTVTIWGTLDRTTVETFVKRAIMDTGAEIEVIYVEKDSATFDAEFVEALAVGTMPDLFILPQDAIIKFRNKITPISYETMPVRMFRDTYIEEAELYLDDEGIVGVPFSIDPLVMYWNRDIFSNAGLVTPPQYWDEFFTFTSKLTKRDDAANIIQSAVALGEFSNVTHAKDIIAALVMQAGNPIVERQNGRLTSILESSLGFVTPPASAAIRFYTEFSNPVGPAYSWNRSLANSREAFLSGRLATYFGYASELNELRNKNPNLNFDVAILPQARDTGKRLTFAEMFAFAVPRNVPNYSLAAYTALLVTGPKGIENWVAASGLPPVRRDMITQAQSDPYSAVFYDSAIIARGWLDPNPRQTDDIFKNMIEGTIVGTRRPQESAARASLELQELLNQL